MTEYLKELGEPLEFWEYFYKISKIPRCSGHEGQIRLFIQKEAEKMGYQTKIDKINNIIIKIPSSSSENNELVISLQSHMDMVCEKNDDVIHDFSKDPLDLEIIEIDSEKWITAKGTTLGADNAVGIAYQLTIMKKIYKKELDLGPISLNLLFTVDEERGLTGASQFDKEFIIGPYMINLDSEGDKTFTIGAAGGRVFEVSLQIEKKIVDQGDDLIPIKLSVTGLTGGHSGVDIDKGRANALNLLSQFLWKLNRSYKIHLISLNGGNLDNAIPREAEVLFFAKRSDFSSISEFIEHNYPQIKKLYESIESDIDIGIKQEERSNKFSIISEDIQNRLINLLFLLQNGPVHLHPITKELVHTSTNFASIKTETNSIKFVVSQRSLTQYDQDNLYDQFQTLFETSGLKLKTVIKYEYPSWPPNFNSKISKLAAETYRELFKSDVIIKAIHAGLECAYFKHHFPNVEIISIGPTIIDVHSPDERLKIKSAEKIWNFLISLLKKLV
ncbi:MAG: beta-Ala-His dipeptidase [Candidatus Hodarchaeota archaeon]